MVERYGQKVERREGTIKNREAGILRLSDFPTAKAQKKVGPHGPT